jgi:nucleotidyltransferase/DNA polymerase involved in DNA repair
MRTCVRMLVACVLIPRFELAVAAGGSAALAGRALTIAPSSGAGAIGETSGAAEAYGVRRGMQLGEALARCPDLELVSADPLAVAEAWEKVLQALEQIGAGVESERPGLAFFALSGLRGIHGGSDELVLAAARRALDRPIRLAAAPGRFCAHAPALRTRPRRTVLVRGSARELLAPQPVGLLRLRARTEQLVTTLERLGIVTLGELASMTRAAVVDRFAWAGLEAHRLAYGEDDPPRPRAAMEAFAESIELPEATNGQALEHALGVLIDRLLARPERRARTLRAARLSARLSDGGSWSSDASFREALCDPLRMRLALTPRLGLLPAPVEMLALEANRFGPPHGDQHSLFAQGAQIRRARLREAIGQLRATVGPDAALRVCWAERASRVPERRALLTPFES